MKRSQTIITYVLLHIVLLGGVLSPHATYAANTTVVPLRGAAGTTFAFTVYGYGSGEQLGYWFVDPAGTTYDPQQRVTTDAAGYAHWEWTVPTQAHGGEWHMTVQGYYRDSPDVLVPFFVDAPAEPAGGTASWQVLPTTVGTPGALLTFVARGGLEPNEQVGIWLVLPDGSILDVNQGSSTDANGQLYRLWQAPADAMGGQWLFRVRGMKSGYTFDIPFTIDNPTTIVDNPSNDTSEPVHEPLPSVLPPDTHTVTPSQAQRGDTLTFTARGFAPGERVGTWAVRPDGTSVEQFDNIYQYVSNDETGFITWQWQVPPDAPAGTWQMNIRGMFSYVQWSIPFDVLGNTLAPPPPNELVGTVAPYEAPRETPVTFTIRGYYPGETIFYWAIDPQGTPYPIDTDVEADEHGTATIMWRVPADEKTGQWTLSTRGDASRKECQVPFTITGEYHADMRIEPTAGEPGTTFQFAASGFYANEEMDFWLTGPREGTRRFDQVFDMTNEVMYADEAGNVWWSWVAPTMIQGGTWHMTARGEDSRVEHTIPFVIERDEPLPLPYSVAPAAGAPGTTFTFAVDDMPTSQLAYWLTAPDGSILPDERAEYRHWRINVANDGHTTWTWTAPPTAQRGTWVMVVRNLSDNFLLRRPKDTADMYRYWEDVKQYKSDAHDQVLEFREYLIYFIIE